MATTPRHWTLPRILVRVVLFFSLFGPALADLAIPDVAAMHLHNPNWPPHAKFHDAQYLVMAALLAAIGLTMLWRRTGNLRLQFHWAAALASVTWLAMFAALLFPGTGIIDPEFVADNVSILGLNPQLFIALVMLVLLAVAVGVERFGRRIPLAPESNRTPAAA
ncbi:DUF6640 family protein [Stackebrandtia nassauensis]|uniref:Acetyltransferase n=1 Tax=Stackebrandtia nassauensis (strain DSM 44728 / CIP 108903 / NRRL B-16338 / NBRC 102104 / LLR-40K-21) TaxID=446470 RepID=D3Q304_STANL|nr:DUF6640 family protein [Stackebrandtia nassauensis]ADD39974.1 hypothetical protein Snas_0256 [Stackebrandtia nassauensis DSM 44728]